VRKVDRISVIVPMFNEEDHVEPLVAAVAAQDYEGEVEMIVSDGGSTDSSVPRLIASAERYGVELRMLENGAGWVSHGLNACIDRATGDLIVRLDCHSRYPSDYLRRCAVAAEETDAPVVGGIVVAEGRTPTERAVACAMDSPFGGIGWMRPPAGGETRRDSDVVTYGAFRREAFDRVGGFDETLRRNQDDEFTLRLRKAGGRVVLDSTIRVSYTPRGSLRGVVQQYWQYGLWKVPVMLKHRTIPSARSQVPIGFVTSLLALAALAARSERARRLLELELALYAACALGFGAVSVRRRQERWALLPLVVAAFPAFHVGYGAGMLRGWLRAALRR
jgi:succinoglycan biosynthesis protein ExoA